MDERHVTTQSFPAYGEIVSFGLHLSAQGIAREKLTILVQLVVK